jgi:potassium-dependent mechanosensitive channel
MRKRILSKIFFLVLILISACIPPVMAENGETRPSAESQMAPIDFMDDMSVLIKHEAAQVKKDLRHQARSLFEHTPLGWDLDTIHYALQEAVMLPVRVPEFVNHVLAQGRVLGVAGSAIVLVFLTAVIYSLIGRKRVLVKAESMAQPFITKLPEEFRPYFYLILVSITAALIPLILLCFYSLVQALIDYDATWFILLGKLLGLWSIGAFLMSLVRGIVDRGILEIRTEYGSIAVRLLRTVILYILIGIAVVWSAGALGLRDDFLALLQFIIFLSIVIVLFLFFLRKKLVLSLLPQLPYPSYQGFIKSLGRYYYPVIIMTFFSGILWCIGYQRFCKVLWTKTWAIAGVYVGFSLIYHLMMEWLRKWSQSVDALDEKTHFLIRSLKGLTLYVTIVVTVIIIMNLLGVLDPIRAIMSFPIMKIGESPLSIWVLIKVLLIMTAFYYGSQFLCAYLDYKVYSAIGVESGLAYAIDTFLKYFLVFIGVFISLQIVGFDLRTLMVFAGAIGIGIGFAMQSVASNLISGFVIIFGGKVRKGDWVEVGGTLGEVTDIYLHATKVRTRDNIEYLVPNSELISSTIVNYTLTSPMIRIRVPFGVSYAADPHEVSKAALDVAEKEASLLMHRKSEIRFTGYGDNSINFELLVWMDIRRYAQDLVRSRLYFAIFDALKKAGIEIPFPQRDLHIRSGVPWEKFSEFPTK